MAKEEQTFAQKELQKIQKAQEETIPAAQLKSQHVFTSAYSKAHNDTYGKIFEEKGEVGAYKYWKEKGFKEHLDLLPKYVTEKAAEVHGIKDKSDSDKAVLTMGYALNPQALQKEIEKSGLNFNGSNFNNAVQGNMANISYNLQKLQLNFDSAAKKDIAKIIGLNKAKDLEQVTNEAIASGVQQWNRGRNPLGVDFYNQAGIELKDPYNKEPDFMGSYKKAA